MTWLVRLCYCRYVSNILGIDSLGHSRYSAVVLLIARKKKLSTYTSEAVVRTPQRKRRRGILDTFPDAKA